MIEGGFTMKILFYDTKSYDIESFDAALSRFPEIEIEYIKYDLDYGLSFFQQNKTGRYFTIERKFILQRFDEMMN